VDLTFFSFGFGFFRNNIEVNSFKKVELKQGAVRAKVQHIVIVLAGSYITPIAATSIKLCYQLLVYITNQHIRIRKNFNAIYLFTRHQVWLLIT